MIGELINERYRIDQRIGQGGMGSIYRAHDTVLDRDVAIKIINRDRLGDEALSCMLCEARAAALLDHPNIVSIYDAGETASISFIVMQLVDGKPLDQVGKLSMTQIIELARQICLALEHAHAHGVIHRDIKPGNILISNNGQGLNVKLTDFGLAYLSTSFINSTQSLIGTVYYMAPEQAVGTNFDERVDLYSLGVLLYEQLTGRLPFQADDPVAVISQHLHDTPPPMRDINPAIPLSLESLVSKLMSKDPGDRPGSASSVMQVLNIVV